MADTKAYIGISYDQEDRESQRWLILKRVKDLGLNEVDIIEESHDRKKSWRECNLGRVIEQFKAGDALVVAEMNCLGSSLHEILEILGVCASKGVSVHAAKGGWSIDPSVPAEAWGMVLLLASEIERDLRTAPFRYRSLEKNPTKERRGRPPGRRKSKLDEHEDALRFLLNRGTSKKWIAEQLGVSTSNLWYWIKTRGVE